MSLKDACALFDDFLKQLGTNIDGRVCDNHVIGDGWVRVNGYALPEAKKTQSAGKAPKFIPLNACLWKLPGENTWTVGYVDDSQGDCRLAEEYCKVGAERVVEHLSFGCPGDEAHEMLPEATVARQLLGTWKGERAIQRILFESDQRITIVNKDTTVKGRWRLSGPNVIDVKAEDGTLPRFNFMIVDNRLYFGSGAATWSRSPEQFVIRLDHNRSIRRLDGKCWLIFERPAKNPVELDCPLRSLKTGALVNLKLPSGEQYALKRLERKDDTGVWLGAVMLDGELRRQSPAKDKL
jgi:hypothetical protein